MCRFHGGWSDEESLDLGSRVGVEWWVGWLANSTRVLKRLCFVGLYFNC